MARDKNKISTVANNQENVVLYGYNVTYLPDVGVFIFQAVDEGGEEFGFLSQWSIEAVGMLHHVAQHTTATRANNSILMGET